MLVCVLILYVVIQAQNNTLNVKTLTKKVTLSPQPDAEDLVANVVKNNFPLILQPYIKAEPSWKVQFYFSSFLRLIPFGWVAEGSLAQAKMK